MLINKARISQTNVLRTIFEALSNLAKLLSFRWGLVGLGRGKEGLKGLGRARRRGFV
jgi:hypothetical protein